jgi:hypothetical protein
MVPLNPFFGESKKLGGKKTERTKRETKILGEK